MSLKSAEKSPSLTQNKSSKKSYLLAFAFSAGSLLTGLAATGLTAVPVASQAAGLGDLFSSDKSATQPKFLPVDEAFQVSIVVATTLLCVNTGTLPKVGSSMDTGV